MIAYIVYNKRSCVTGRALFEWLKANRVGGYRWRRSCKNPPRGAADLVIRWGNSLHDVQATVELNSRDAVRNATKKLEMMRILNEHSLSPPVVFHENSSMNNRGDERTAIANLANEEGMVYYRTQYDEVRYTNPSSIPVNFQYVSKPIDKVAEYRVHVFDGKCVGVYEKVPNQENVRIFKDHNCDFVRLDMSNEDNRRKIKGVRPKAVEAVGHLNLLFGGVDVIVDRDRNIYVLEVNSAPGLNEPNIERWGQKFAEYITNGQS